MQCSLRSDLLSLAKEAELPAGWQTVPFKLYFQVHGLKVLMLSLPVRALLQRHIVLLDAADLHTDGKAACWRW